EQLARAVRAVFESWDNPRAQVYRRAHEIPDDLGTAVNVVQMVFGNKGEDSGTGVAFTRDPSTGEAGLYGEFLANAQGEDVVAGIEPGQLEQLLHPMLDPSANYDVVATGLNASPGAASGKAVFDAATAEQRGSAGESVILVRWETTPDDYYGMRHAAGILTTHGGLTSHAAVVARGEGIPCVTGCEALYLEPGLARLNGNELPEGDLLTIDR